MTNEELIKAARAEANCKQFYKKYSNCHDCQMPNKENPSYQRIPRMCVGFDEEVLPQLADALEAADKRMKEMEEQAENSIVCGWPVKDLIALYTVFQKYNVSPKDAKALCHNVQWCYEQIKNEQDEMFTKCLNNIWQALPQPPKKG